jgi:3-oxocholest-4-en-26-oate---CoA ligase
MEMHAATVFESIVDAIGDAPALIHGDVRRSWSEYDERSARLASAFVDAGLVSDSKIGMYLYNSPEYMETQYAGFKMRGVPVNVNYRYLDDELWYLLENSDAEALVFHSSLGDRVARVVDRLPKLRLLIEVNDGDAGQVPGAVDFDSVVVGHDPMARITRAEDDVYMLYTGGTTGMPKGVMYAMGGLTAGFIDGGFPLAGMVPTKDASQVASMIAASQAAGGPVMRSVPGCPLMHGTGMWLGALIPQLTGGTVITLQKRNFDPGEMFAVAAAEQATNLVIVGDSFAKPMIRTLDEAAAAGTPYDTSSLKMVISSGVMWTSEVKEELLERIQQLVLLDAMGSSEGAMGMQITMRGMPADTAKFSRSPTTKVFTEDDREVEPGSDEVGMVAAGGNVPFGYYKDEEKSARTFRVIDGERYSFPGDLAMVNADGSLVLLGRGSQVINSAGEKIFPEEVEEAVKRAEGVLDCLVVGIDDEKFGQAVTAVASLVEGATVEEAAVIASVKSQLSGFKAPKRVVFVASVPRAPNGKADYKAAKAMALESLGLA